MCKYICFRVFFALEKTLKQLYLNIFHRIIYGSKLQRSMTWAGCLLLMRPII